MVTAGMKLKGAKKKKIKGAKKKEKVLTPWKKSYDQPRQHIKKQTHYIANKGLS